MTRWMSAVRAGAVGVGLFLAATAAQAATLNLRVTDVTSAEHQVVVQVYRGSDGFRDPENAVRRVAVPAKSGTVPVTLEGLKPGRYAVVVYHDQDGDGGMDRFLGMIPTEGYGLSRNPEVTGPPAFADSAFDLPATGAELAIEMRY
ncbi:MAG TPA: DUF2141 domain-containing protein [Gammaproteobacteria bacterium]|nr:DUF2141 domain-containing protein [Gammaproteobacteria bacterium]